MALWLYFTLCPSICGSYMTLLIVKILAPFTTRNLKSQTVYTHWYTTQRTGVPLCSCPASITGKLWRKALCYVSLITCLGKKWLHKHVFLSYRIAVVNVLITLCKSHLQVFNCVYTIRLTVFVLRGRFWLLLKVNGDLVISKRWRVGDTYLMVFIFEACF